MNTNERSALCPRVEAVFGLLAKKWMGLIIYSLIGGELYFCDLEKAIPALSARVLTERIRELELEGLVLRKISNSSPVRVSYVLTENGKSLASAVQGIADWANA
ncbi:MAG: helix-turn-helix domain-containing protein [Rectinemataceae bacterium]|jgi:DNA-binding HxlR family transcriptional regulator